MISLTRLSGSVFLLNPDLVERVDRTPDTVVTLVDGTKYVVTESIEEFRELVVSYRAEIVARCSSLEPPARRDTLPRRSAARLAAVPMEEDGSQSQGTTS